MSDSSSDGEGSTPAGGPNAGGPTSTAPAPAAALEDDDDDEDALFHVSHDEIRRYRNVRRLCLLSKFAQPSLPHGFPATFFTPNWKREVEN